MNVWMRDERVAKAEVDAFEAERAERRGDHGTARERYHDAAEGFASVALSVPSDHPNTRCHLAIAAVASFARAGDFGRAIEYGRRILVESDALTADGRQELGRLVSEYATLVAQPSSPRVPPAQRGQRVRDAVRDRFRMAVV